MIDYIKYDKLSLFALSFYQRFFTINKKKEEISSKKFPKKPLIRRLFE